MEAGGILIPPLGTINKSLKWMKSTHWNEVYISNGTFIKKLDMGLLQSL